jgi:hypothetical protein
MMPTDHVGNGYRIGKLGSRRIKLNELKGGGGAEGVRLIVASTTISNLFYNLPQNLQSTIYRQKLAKIYSFLLKCQQIQSTNLQDFGQIFQPNLQSTDKLRPPPKKNQNKTQQKLN